MNKKEFLDILQQALEGEISPQEIEKNINYYDQYISNGSEEVRLNELGNPRLIAKTIIESRKVAKEKEGYTQYSERYKYQEEHNEAKNDNYERSKNSRSNILFTNFKWYQKAILIVIFIVLLLIVTFLGGIIIRLLFIFGLPILLLIFLYTLFRKR